MVLPLAQKIIRKEAGNCDMRHKLGCVVLKGNRVLASAHNQRRHAFLPKRSWQRREGTVCAERMALLKLLDKANNSVVYVGRVNEKGDFLLAKPCEACMNMMRDLGIKKIFYSDGNGNFKEM